MPAKMSRRRFLMGCSSAIAAMAGARLTHLAFADVRAAGSFNDEILVVVFLRGGWDALNVAPPIGGDDRGYYELARPGLQVPDGGIGAALPLDGLVGLHPAMAPLYTLYQARKMAVVHAVGLTSDTRSHFDAMQFMELGTPGVKNTPNGWITRHLQSAPNLPPTILLPALSAGSSPVTSLLGYPDAATMGSLSSFNLAGDQQYEDAQRAAVRQMYSGTTWLDQAGTQTLDTVDLIESANPGTYVPANGAVYPSGSFGDNLQTIAQLIKMEVGLRVATIDLGGWDTHEHQGDGSTGYLATNQLTPLAQGLAALYADLDGACPQHYTNKLTLVVMSEFGRRLRENANHGTDHGHGNVMLVLGGNVNGGQVYGPWPGLHTSQLYDSADLAVATDYRQVLSEIIVKRLGNPNLSAIFPNYAGYQPLGIVQGGGGPGGAIPPDQTNRIYLPIVGRDFCP